MFPRTPTLAATTLAAIPAFGRSAETYNGLGAIPAGQDLAAATFPEAVASGGGF